MSAIANSEFAFMIGDFFTKPSVSKLWLMLFESVKKDHHKNLELYKNLEQGAMTTLARNVSPDTVVGSIVNTLAEYASSIMSSNVVSTVTTAIADLSGSDAEEKVKILCVAIENTNARIEKMVNVILALSLTCVVIAIVYLFVKLIERRKLKEAHRRLELLQIEDED